jgi:hypothetical protein
VPLRCVPGYLPPVTESIESPASGRRPPPPPFRLPPPQRRPGGVLASLVVHGLILFVLIRYGVQWVTGGGDAPGPRGGGGGSGGDTRYVQLPALAAPAPAAPAVPPPTPVAQLPVPVPVHPATPVPDEPFVPPPVAPTPASPAAGAGAGGTGEGPGSAGGTGGGTSGGVGNDSGPGRGGDGEYITPPYARTVLLPATCARGRFTVRFWVEADGHVSRVTVDPPPKGGGCRQEMQDKMMGYQFLPAHTRNGRPVAAVTEVQLQQ